MSVSQPSGFPEWASNPPSPPPTTIVEPSDPEKQAGFQPTNTAEVLDFVIAVFTGGGTHTYSATVNGVTANYTQLITDTLANVIHGLALALTALGQPISVSETLTAARCTSSVAGQAFSYSTSDGPNVVANLIQANRTAKPARQYVNWFFNKVYQWIKYQFYTALAWLDIGGAEFDAINQGTLPSTGAGLSHNSGTGVSYITDPASQIRRAQGLLEAHSYPDNKDTYLDLTYEGAWSYSSVNNGFSAPALGANSRRQYKVVATGGAVVSVADLRSSEIAIGHLQPFRFKNQIRMTQEGGQTLAELQHHYTTGTFNLISEMNPDDNTVGSSVRVYVDQTGNLLFVEAASFDGSHWNFDPNNASASEWFLGINGETVYKVYNGADHWNDSAWVIGQQLSGRLELGSDLLTSLANALLSRLRVDKAASGTAPRTLLFEDQGGAAGAKLRIYLAHTGAGDFSGDGTLGGPCLEVTLNAAWDGTNARWQQDASGQSSKHELGGGGFRSLWFNSGSQTHFLEEIDNNTAWNVGLIADFATKDVFTSPQIRTHSLTGWSGHVNPAAAWGTAGNADAAHQAGTAGSVTWPVHLPDGAVITDASWYGTNDTGGGGNTTGTFIRIPKSSGTPEDIANGSWASSGSFTGRSYGTITPGRETVDNENYAYAINLSCVSAANTDIASVAITYFTNKIAGA